MPRITVFIPASLISTAAHALGEAVDREIRLVTGAVVDKSSLREIFYYIFYAGGLSMV
jgi:hypothetical protein